MQTISMTQARRELARISQTPDDYNLTSRGESVAVLHVGAAPKFDPEKAQEAARRILALSEQAKIVPGQGATQLIRELRDA